MWTWVGNHLRELPPEIGQLKALGYVYLSDNQLVDLDPSSASSRTFVTASLDRNRLTLLPARIGELAPLEGLDLSRNH